MRSLQPTRIIYLEVWVCLLLAPQVYVGDFVKVDDETSRSGYSVGQVAELYQDAAVGAAAALWVLPL